MTGTLTELHYTEVLNNLAMISANPGALPYYSLATTGTGEVTDKISSPSTLTWKPLGTTWVPFGLAQEVLGLTPERDIRENWTLASTLYPEQLEAMHCVYLLTLGNYDCGDCKKSLEPFFTFPDQGYAATKPKYPLRIPPPGWLGVGEKCDVPKNACYVGHYRHTYVWVTPDGIGGLTQVTLAILNIATFANYPQVPPTGSYGPLELPPRTNFYDPYRGLFR
jgi:hypothetical protein